MAAAPATPVDEREDGEVKQIPRLGPIRRYCQVISAQMDAHMAAEGDELITFDIQWPAILATCKTLDQLLEYTIVSIRFGHVQEVNELTSAVAQHCNDLIIAGGPIPRVPHSRWHI